MFFPICPLGALSHKTAPPAWHWHAHIGELRDHLTQGRALAADLLHVGVPELLDRSG